MEFFRVLTMSGRAAFAVVQMITPAKAAVNGSNGTYAVNVKGRDKWNRK